MQYLELIWKLENVIVCQCYYRLFCMHGCYFLMLSTVSCILNLPNIYRLGHTHMHLPAVLADSLHVSNVSAVSGQPVCAGAPQVSLKPLVHEKTLPLRCSGVCWDCSCAALGVGQRGILRSSGAGNKVGS